MFLQFFRDFVGVQFLRPSLIDDFCELIWDVLVSLVICIEVICDSVKQIIFWLPGWASLCYIFEQHVAVLIQGCRSFVIWISVWVRQFINSLPFQGSLAVRKPYSSLFHRASSSLPDSSVDLSFGLSSSRVRFPAILVGRNLRWNFLLISDPRSTQHV